MSDFDHDKWRQNLAATETEEQRRSLSPDELDRYLQYFKSVRFRAEVAMSQVKRDDWKERIELLRTEKGLRRVESLSKSQHDETMVLGGKTLNWTKVAAWGAIAAVIVALMGLGVQSYCSRPSFTPSEARPTPTPQPPPTETPSQ